MTAKKSSKIRPYVIQVNEWYSIVIKVKEVIQRPFNGRL